MSKFRPSAKNTIREIRIETVHTQRGTRERTQKLTTPARQPSPVKNNNVRPYIMEPEPEDSAPYEGTYEMHVQDNGDVVFEVVSKTENRSGKSQNDFMREWRDHFRKDFAARLLSLKAGPTPHSRCENCGSGKAIWRCRSCLGGRVLCVLCLREAHTLLPLHRVERWNGRFFQKGALWQVGVKLYIGHKGSPCPKFQYAGTQTTPVGSFESAIHVAEEQAMAEEARSLAADASSEAQPSQTPCDQTPWKDIPHPQDIEDEIWEDEEEPERLPGPIPRLQPRAPNSDTAGNPFITVVDTSGFHQLPVVWCSCRGRQHDRHLQLLDMRFYPASVANIKTIFTFAVLDDNRTDNLECKTSAYQYHSKLRRITAPAFPSGVPNRYPELRRVSRQWRNLRLRQYHGISGDSAPARGEMALFCAACPQPGVNLPENWEEDQAANPNVYMRLFAADGNFKADHLMQRNPDDDVALTDGEAFMTNEARYQEHLKVAVESEQVPDCNHYRVQDCADTAPSGRDRVGLGGHCCAGHGCFAPGSMVDFHHAERQSNMDWSWCETVKTTNTTGLRKLGRVYDLECQYSKHLLERIEDNPFLSFDEQTEMVHAIGLFHVHGHKDECLYRYATNYVPGAGVVDGEILETLWAVLNLVSPSTRTATIFHRAEILDDHMGDSNFKKMINIVSTIIAKYRRAISNHAMSCRYFKEMDETAPPASRNEWKVEIENAEKCRSEDVKSMDVMLPRVSKGPSMKEIQVILQNTRDHAAHEPYSGAGNTTEWLVNGLKMEESQVELRQIVRRMGKRPTLDQKLELARKRQRLALRVREFHQKAESLFGAAIVLQHSTHADIIQETDGNISDGMNPDAPTPVASDIENRALVFPSRLCGEAGEHLDLLRASEEELRKGQANDVLQGVRETLGHLSFQYIEKVRRAQTTGQHLRSWKGIRQLNEVLSFHRRVYNINRRALTALNPLLKPRYPPLLVKDCAISTAVSDTNAPGQSQARLAWFWGALDGYDPDNAQSVGGDNHRLVEFYRIHWLRARAQNNRWTEEIARTEHEMTWVTLFFMHQAKKWSHYISDAESERDGGRMAYGAQQVHLWEELGCVADARFQETSKTFVSCWKPSPVGRPPES